MLAYYYFIKDKDGFSREGLVDNADQYLEVDLGESFYFSDQYCDFAKWVYEEEIPARLVLNKIDIDVLNGTMKVLTQQIISNLVD